jgi:hypothetical protein
MMVTELDGSRLLQKSSVQDHPMTKKTYNSTKEMIEMVGRARWAFSIAGIGEKEARGTRRGHHSQRQ